MAQGPQAQEARARAAEGRGSGREAGVVSDFNVANLDHVTITTPAELEPAVLEWYEQCLGLEAIEKPEGSRRVGGWFRVGDQELHVTHDEHNPHKTAHFGLAVDDIEGAVQRLRDFGCHIEQASKIPGRRRFFTRDPAGNNIEIVSYE